MQLGRVDVQLDRPPTHHAASAGGQLQGSGTGLAGGTDAGQPSGGGGAVAAASQRATFAASGSSRGTEESPVRKLSGRPPKPGGPAASGLPFSSSAALAASCDPTGRPPRSVGPVASGPPVSSSDTVLVESDEAAARPRGSEGGEVASLSCGGRRCPAKGSLGCCSCPAVHGEGCGGQCCPAKGRGSCSFCRCCCPPAKGEGCG